MAPSARLRDQNITIRKASGEDALAISGIGGEAFPESGVSEEKTLNRMARGHLMLVAEIEGTTVGFIDLKPGLSSVRVSGLATLQKFRGMGVGTALLEHGISIARKEGKLSIVLRVAARNLRALNLYKCLGFFIVARRARPDGRAIYSMARKFET